MTIRDLFKIIIKLFGLYLLVTSLWMIFQLLSIYISGTVDSFHLLGVVFFGALVMAISLSFILKPAFYIDLLKLDRGFDASRIKSRDRSRIGLRE